MEPIVNSLSKSVGPGIRSPFYSVTELTVRSALVTLFVVDWQCSYLKRAVLLLLSLLPPSILPSSAIAPPILNKVSSFCFSSLAAPSDIEEVGPGSYPRGQIITVAPFSYEGGDTLEAMPEFYCTLSGNPPSAMRGGHTGSYFSIPFCASTGNPLQL